MRKTLSMLCLLVFLVTALPAQAQLRADVYSQRSPAKLFDQGGAGFALNKLFSPEHFRMGHSYEMSFGSFGGQSSSLGMYTNTMMFQFNQKLAARVDLSFAHSPFGGSGLGSGFGPDERGGKFFLQNAEIAYRPAENVQLHFSMRQSPYGGYMGPYGYYNPYYGRGSFLNASYGTRGDNLFWNNNLR